MHCDASVISDVTLYELLWRVNLVIALFKCKINFNLKNRLFKFGYKFSGKSSRAVPKKAVNFMQFPDASIRGWTLLMGNRIDFKV